MSKRTYVDRETIRIGRTLKNIELALWAFFYFTAFFLISYTLLSNPLLISISTLVTYTIGISLVIAVQEGYL